MADQGLEYTPFHPAWGFSPDQEAGWELTDNESRLRHGYGFFAMILAGYRYNVGHAEEPAEENSNEAVHTEPSDDA